MGLPHVLLGHENHDSRHVFPRHEQAQGLQVVPYVPQGHGGPDLDTVEVVPDVFIEDRVILDVSLGPRIDPVAQDLIILHHGLRGDERSHGLFHRSPQGVLDGAVSSDGLVVVDYRAGTLDVYGGHFPIPGRQGARGEKQEQCKGP